MDERRSDLRRRLSGAGKIVATADRPAIDCTVLDVSISGACIETSSDVELPNAFHLVPHDGDPSGYPCRVVWRRERRVGVKFD